VASPTAKEKKTTKMSFRDYQRARLASNASATATAAAPTTLKQSSSVAEGPAAGEMETKNEVEDKEDVKMAVRGTLGEGAEPAAATPQAACELAAEKKELGLGHEERAIGGATVPVVVVLETATEDATATGGVTAITTAVVPLAPAAPVAGVAAVAVAAGSSV
jgi:hypothetical protein